MTGMIPTDVYSENLRSFLWKFQAISEEDKAVHILLLKICGTILHKRPDDSRTLDFIGKVLLNREENDLILKYDLINCANCEVKARCCDVLSKKSGNRKKVLTTSSNYTKSKINFRLNNQISAEFFVYFYLLTYIDTSIFFIHCIPLLSPFVLCSIIEHNHYIT